MTRESKILSGTERKTLTEFEKVQIRNEMFEKKKPIKNLTDDTLNKLESMEPKPDVIKKQTYIPNYAGDFFVILLNLTFLVLLILNQKNNQNTWINLILENLGHIPGTISTEGVGVSVYSLKFQKGEADSQNITQINKTKSLKSEIEDTKKEILSGTQKTVDDVDLSQKLDAKEQEIEQKRQKFLGIEFTGFQKQEQNFKDFLKTLAQGK